MIDEIKRSISATLYERTTSPLFGTFFFSWSVWNWKILIALFFTTSAELKTTKFEYIDTNLLNLLDGLVYPVISTILILTIYSWLSEHAYRLWLFFDKRKNDYKNEIEKQKLLTIEQSMKLRLEIARKEESFEKLLREKEELIQALKNENSELLESINLKSDNLEKVVLDGKLAKQESEDMNLFFEYEEAIRYFDEIANYVQHNWKFENESIPDKIASYYIAHGLIEKSGGAALYDFTEKGKKYLKEHFYRRTKDIIV